MSPQGTLHLSWSDFQTNVAKSFQIVRQDQEYCDVTLACEGEQLIRAHRVVLSAGSTFFRNILQKTQEHHLLYIRSGYFILMLNLIFVFRGVDQKEMNSLLNFIYCGEARIEQVNICIFILHITSLHYFRSIFHIF